MSRPRLFIDGHAGTTGLRIRQWLAGRDDVDLVTLNESERKSEPARRKAIAESNLVILCLPDEAAREAARWAAESGARVLDASSSHRVADGWVYGLPELTPGQRDAIRGAGQVTNPGCYPSAFLLLIRPLVDAGLLPAEAPIAIHALSGYSGGGKPLIERWESPETRLSDHVFEAPYALDRIHKHIPEMHRYSGLRHAPQFVPAVGPFPNGMRVEIPLHASLLAPNTRAETAWEILADRYRTEPFVELAPLLGGSSGAPGSGPGADLGAGDPAAPLDEWTLDPTALNGTNRIRLHVFPNPAGHLLLVGLLDNLGKGASGVAIQSLNLMLGLAEEAGLPR